MKILVVDDHPLFRDALELSIRQAWADADIVSIGSLDGVGAARFDLIVLDWRMPGGGGADPFTRLRRAGVEGPVAVVTGAEDLDTAIEVLRSGADAFLPKTTPRRVLAQALRLVAEGGSFFPRDVALELLSQSGTLGESDAGAAEEQGDGADADGESDFGVSSPLTEREEQVLGMLATGATNKEIGRQLSLQEVTVKLHTRRILRKLGARNRTDAVRRAQEAGLLTHGLSAAS
ncbi:response regulator transcription factor [Azospirillum griseum]|uniref:Response regulator transcription factor n=1 Tax=Azospirillum griseum TaxID=2496639 RepID=A0A3S0K3G7_9PROT|nr:response regulator transcription factor [Azospirillum griseum]RTR18095.1 response regulator transcription factor [Azospirillum griseum]